MHDSHVVKGVAGIVCAIALAGCSLWLNTDERQCHEDDDCTKANLGDKCVQQVCMSTADMQQPQCTSSDCEEASMTNTDFATASCESDSDCGGKLPRCLGKHCVDQKDGDYWLCPVGDKTVMTAMVLYAFHVVDFLTRDPPKGVTVHACRNMDLDCTTPVGMFTDTDGTGHVQILVPSGFSGYFEVLAEGEMDTLLYVTQPIVKNTTNRDLPLLNPDIIDVTASMLGVPYDMAKGLVLLEAIDCSGSPQAGVHFSTKSDGVPFYLVNQLPSKDQMVTVYDTSNNSADGGFINVPLGFATFSAQVGTSASALQLGAFNAQVRPNTITFIDMHF